MADQHMLDSTLHPYMQGCQRVPAKRRPRGCPKPPRGVGIIYAHYWAAPLYSSLPSVYPGQPLLGLVVGYRGATQHMCPAHVGQQPEGLPNMMDGDLYGGDAQHIICWAAPYLEEAGCPA